ncbi:MAG: hypothetical protein V1853_03690 [bacterium]
MVKKSKKSGVTKKAPVAVKTETKLEVHQRIALMFMVTVGFIVLGSAVFAAVYTWTYDDNIAPAATQTIPTNGQVLGVDQTFTTPLAD